MDNETRRYMTRLFTDALNYMISGPGRRAPQPKPAEEPRDKILEDLFKWRPTKC